MLALAKRLQMHALETIKLIQFRAAYNLPVHAGIERGIFARHGLMIEPAYTPGSEFISRALKEGRFDIGHTGADDIIADVESDERSDLFLFMGLHSGLFSLVGSGDVATIDLLRGKPIGVDARRSGFALVLQALLHSKGWSREDYRLIEIGGWESRYHALLEGKISATLLTEPYVTKALAGGCRLLVEDGAMIAVYQGSCGAASRRWAEQHGESLVRYIRAYVEATRWCLEIQNRRDCLALLARHNGIDGLVAEKTLDAVFHPRYGLHPKAALNLSGIGAVLAVRAEMGYLGRPLPRAEKYVDLTYYHKALAIGG